MSEYIKADVIVVGAGIIGLAAALAVAKLGLHVILVETKTYIAGEFPLPEDEFDSKVVAVTRASQHFLSYLGVWQAIVKERQCAYQYITVWDEARDGIIHFSAADFFEPDLGHIIEQKVIATALWQALQTYSNVTVMLGASPQQLSEEKNVATLTLSTEVCLQAPLVIAADGTHSLVRQLCGVQTKGWDYGQTAIVATVEGEKAHHATAFQRFASNGPLALLPLSRDHHSSIVWTLLPEEAKTLCDCLEDDFNTILTRESHGVMGALRVRGKRFAFPLSTHHAKTYVASRCVLVGDAAHTLHPLAGQGANLGWMDVAALMEVLEQTIKKHRDYGELTVLKRYERARKWHNQMMIGAMELFKQGFGSSHPLIQQWRNLGLNWVDKQRPLKQFFAQCALGTLGPLPVGTVSLFR